MSHIIPRSYFKALKHDCGQLLMVNSGDDNKPKSSNADPKEKLLCRKCEWYINDKYERYGTRLLKDEGKKIENSVIFENFKFEEFYLYLMSILWRVSISSLPRYKSIKLDNSLNDLLRDCLNKGTMKISESIKLDHFFKISVIRITDKSGQQDDLSINQILLDFNVEIGPTAEDGFVYFFMVDGFLITYHLSAEKDVTEAITKKNYGQITNKKKLSVPISDICEFKQLVEGFNYIRKKQSAQR